MQGASARVHSRPTVPPLPLHRTVIDPANIKAAVRVCRADCDGLGSREVQAAGNNTDECYDSELTEHDVPFPLEFAAGRHLTSKQIYL